MTAGSYFIGPPETADAAAAGYTALAWPVNGHETTTVESDLAWNLSPLPGVTRETTDLLHLAAGAYMADRLTSRGVRFSRDLALEVAVLAPDAWTDDLLDDVAELLGWLTGDTWNVTVTAAPDADLPESLPTGVTGPVSLLSGGLDSFLGAIDLLQSGQHPSFVGHKDSATAVRHAQAAAHCWLERSFAPAPSYTRVALSQAGRRAEPSSRSRSLMFLSIGVAVAVSSGSSSLVVPENGYTGINLPLRPNRSGALSTRSTHPETIRRFSAVLDALDIGVNVVNPYEWMTKGEVMAKTVASAPPQGWDETAWVTLSCSKLNGNWFGDSPNHNCGLCVPCLVRRATFIRAGVPDGTTYVFQELKGSSLSGLLEARRGDIEAVKYAVANGVDADAIDAGTWPPGYDLDQAEDLVRRGLEELALLTLP